MSPLPHHGPKTDYSSFKKFLQKILEKAFSEATIKLCITGKREKEDKVL